MHKEDSESVPGVSTELRVGWRARSEESGAVGDENIEMGLPERVWRGSMLLEMSMW